MAKKKEKELTVKEVATSKEPGLFTTRVSEQRCEVRGTIFVIESIPKNVKRYAISKFKNLSSTNQVLQTLDLITLIFRLGCTNIEGLKDSDGNDVEITFDTVNIDGKKRQAISKSIAEGLPDEVISVLGARILTIDSLSDEELAKLDFTKSS